MSELPKVVSKRNHFTSIDEYVDEGIRMLALMRVFADTSEKQEQLRMALRQVIIHLLRDFVSTFERAAHGGVEQAVHLIIDPEFYEHRKQRHRASLKKFAEERSAEKKREAERKLMGPSADEIRMKRIRLTRDIDYYTELASKAKRELAELPNVVSVSRERVQ